MLKREYDYLDNINSNDMRLCRSFESEYEEGYISDLISKIADIFVEIYNSNLLDLAKDLYFSDYIDWDDVEEMSEKNIISQLSLAHYLYNECVLYKNLNNLKYNVAVNHLNELGKELDEEVVEEIVKDCDFIEEIIEGIDDYIENIEELL